MKNNSESRVEILRHNDGVLCGKDGCKFKYSKDNKYCNKHQICIFLDETQDLGKKHVLIMFVVVENSLILIINSQDAKIV
jgi:hypothetical protein